MDFEQSVLRNRESKTVASKRSERSIVQIRRDVYDSHRHRVFSVAYYMTGNEVSAEAILARCFTQAFLHKEEPDAGDVDRSLMNVLREEGAVGEMTLRGVPEAGAALAAGENIRRTDMEEALRELPAAERLVFLLSDVEGYRTAKIAELTGRPASEIAVALLGVRLRLREAIAAIRKKREDAA